MPYAFSALLFVLSLVTGIPAIPQFFRMRKIKPIQSSSFQIHRYKTGDTVEVVYDKNAPWLAYAKKEWDSALRDLWLAGGELLISIVLWNIGLALNLQI